MITIHTKRHRKLVDILRDERKKRNMSQNDLAAKLRTSQTAITRMERHGRRIDVVEFLILCEELSLDPAKLIRKIQALARE